MLLLEIPSLTWEQELLRVVVAAGLGGAVGLERELREREAGFRTHLLVSVGSCLFTLVSAYGFHEFLVGGGNIVRTDPTRIAAQIVTGVGFLGAGAIIRQGFSVRGLTTAATLWVVAAIGMASGAGYYSAAVITTALVLFSLWPLRIIAFRTMSRFRPETDRLLAQLPTGESPAPLIERLEALGGQAAGARGRSRGRPQDGADGRDAPAEGGRAGDRGAALGARARAGGPLERLTVRLCSQNRNKLRELSALLPGWELELLDADGYPEEGSDSYYENARGKAVYGREVGPAEAWMLGEDSGLEVAALGGAPGVRSARYGAEGGEAIERLLRELEGVEDRRARYVCELVLIGPGRRGAARLRRARGPDRRASRAGRRASATTRSSSRPARSATVAELGNDWKSPQLAPRPSRANLQGQSQ